jgi:hypothetical protein
VREKRVGLWVLNDAGMCGCAGFRRDGQETAAGKREPERYSGQTAEEAAANRSYFRTPPTGQTHGRAVVRWHALGSGDWGARGHLRFVHEESWKGDRGNTGARRRIGIVVPWRQTGHRRSETPVTCSTRSR